MIRNILGILGGYLVFGLSSALIFGISKVDPSQPASIKFILLSGLLAGIAAFLVGYLTALIGRQKKYWPVVMLSVLLILIGVVSIIAQPGKSHWSELLTIFAFSPLVILGGALRLKQNKS